MFKRWVMAGAALLALTGGGQALAQDADFDLINRTGYAIREVYVAPTKSKTWGDDMLGKKVMENGDRWTFTFPKRSSQCRQDIMVVFDDDNSEVVWEDFDLCSLTKITLKYNRKSNEVSADYE